jgi:hypothetical protein
MKKRLLSVLILLIISISACQQAAKEPAMEKNEDSMQKKTPKVEAPQITGEASVDAVGSGLTNVDAVEKDLSSDDLSDVDAGLADVQNI